jgi:hypothetical protein
MRHIFSMLGLSTACEMIPLRGRNIENYKLHFARDNECVVREDQIVYRF